MVCESLAGLRLGEPPDVGHHNLGLSASAGLREDRYLNGCRLAATRNHRPDEQPAHQAEHCGADRDEEQRAECREPFTGGWLIGSHERSNVMNNLAWA